MQGRFKRDSSYFLSLLNRPILQLYRSCIPASPGTLSNFHRKTILEVKGPNKFVYNEEGSTQNFDEWKVVNTFCYEVISKIRSTDSGIGAKMLQDLNAHFNLNGRIEKRPETLYKLVYTGKGIRPLKSTGNTNAIEWADKEEEKNLYNKQIKTKFSFDQQSCFRIIFFSLKVCLTHVYQYYIFPPAQYLQPLHSCIELLPSTRSARPRKPSNN